MSSKVDPDLHKNAASAVAAFRSMIPQLTSYARATTGRQNITIIPARGAPRTDGTKIYYEPPMALGSKFPHDRNVCDRVDSTGLFVCIACRTRREVLVNIYHEIAHIGSRTFAPSQQWFKDLRKEDPHLFPMLNALEDVRVDNAMFAARKGLRKMFDADVLNILETGIDRGDGENEPWSSLPTDPQILHCIVTAGCNYPSWNEYYLPEIVGLMADETVSDIMDRSRRSNSVFEIVDLCREMLSHLRSLGYFQLEVPEDREPGDEQDEEDNSGGQDEQEGNNGPGKPEDSEEGGGEDSGDQHESERADEVSGTGDAGSSEPEDEDGGSDGVSQDDSGDCADEPSDEKGDSESEDLVDDDEPDSTLGEGESPTGESSPEPEGEHDDLASDRGDSPGDGGGEEGRGSGRGEPTPTGELPEPRADSDSTESNRPEGREEDRPDTSEGEQEGDLESEEVLDSGADEGKGGIRTEVATEGDLLDALQGAHDCKEDFVGKYGQDANRDEGEAVSASLGSPDAENSEEESNAIGAEIMRGDYFETPSFGVTRVVEVEYDPKTAHETHGWSTEETRQRALGLNFTRAGIRGDFDPDESLIGGALGKARRAFSDNETVSRQNNLRSGRVDRRVLGRRAWGNDDRIFTKRRVPDKRDYAVLLVLDISFSNLGSNLVLLKKSVLAQAELLHRLGVKFSIVAHSAKRDVYEGNYGFAFYLHRIKGWNEPWSEEKRNGVRQLAPHQGNLDGCAMEFSSKEINRVQATDKIVLYYTDGKMPAANHDEELVKLQGIIPKLRNSGVTLLGVGMATDSPTRHGLDTVMVQGPEDVKAVIEQLSKRLTRK